MLIVDAHEDLAWNMLTFGRDYTLSSAQIRQAEAGGPTPDLNDDALLGWPDYQRGQVAVVFASLYVTPIRYQLGGWDRLAYADVSQAERLYRQQIDAYERLANDHADKFRLIYARRDLGEVLKTWEDDLSSSPKDKQGAAGDEASENGSLVGLVISMEGAEGVRDPGELDQWWQRGVRIIGLAWSGTRFCGGTKEPGPLTAEGFAMLEGMSDLGFGLDLSHMDEQAALQALDAYPGVIIATHSNAQALVKDPSSNRHLSDRLIHGIIERDGVIGLVAYNGFLKAGWRRGDRRQEVGLDRLVAQIDYICQLAGDARHAGIGTDFDGGFGLQSVPPGIESIADLQNLAAPLAEMGYTSEDIAAILGANWLARLKKILPESV
jgi:membrane dipeptidase